MIKSKMATPDQLDETPVPVERIAVVDSIDDALHVIKSLDLMKVSKITLETPSFEPAVRGSQYVVRFNVGIRPHEIEENDGEG